MKINVSHFSHITTTKVLGSERETVSTTRRLIVFKSSEADWFRKQLDANSRSPSVFGKNLANLPGAYSVLLYTDEKASQPQNVKYKSLNFVFSLVRTPPRTFLHCLTKGLKTM